MRDAHAKTADLATVLATELKPAVDNGALYNKAFSNQLFLWRTRPGTPGRTSWRR